MPESQGGYSFMKDEIFEKEEDLDILFVGGSVIWNGVDSPQVQRELSTRLGRPARVATFGYNFNSIDISYTAVRDLLERRRVRMVVFSIPRLAYPKGPSVTSYRFLRYGEDDVVEGLPLDSRISLYACSVLRAPHDLLTIVRRNPSTAKTAHSESLGAFLRKEGMAHDPGAFARFTPPAPPFSSAELIYSDSTSNGFRFEDNQLPAHQDYYLEKLMELLREREVPLAILNVPQYGERDNDQIIERLDWPRRFGSDIPIIGVRPSLLFAGLDEEGVEKLHSDLQHFNLNGSEYYTHAVLPAILDVYETHATKKY